LLELGLDFLRRLPATGCQKESESATKGKTQRESGHAGLDVVFALPADTRYRGSANGRAFLLAVGKLASRITVSDIPYQNLK
jgi:hypothetical protein